MRLGVARNTAVQQITQWLPGQETQALCASPNMFAPPPATNRSNGTLHVRGYQEFVACATTVEPVSYGLVQKTRVLSTFLSARHFDGRSVLDLGANSGYFSLKALHCGAMKVTAIDVDAQSLEPLRQAKKEFSLEKLDTVVANVSDWTATADIVLALALIHWIYSCTSTYGSIDAAIKKLAALTTYMCIIEWVAPEDPLILDFKHTQWNNSLHHEPYTTAAFEKAMDKYFARWQHIGSVSPTRKLFAAFVSRKKRELGGPLPLLMDRDKLVSSSKLADVDGIEYWSRVYDPGDGTIIKQASFDLASREAPFLKQLSPYTPKVLSVRQFDLYSVLEIEKINGIAASNGSAVIDSNDSYFKFADGLLAVLECMQQAGISHRDLHAENILIRDALPVLIDFSWSTFSDSSHILPAGLLEGLPDQTIPCDIFSAGSVLKSVNNGRFPQFNVIHELMIEPSPQLRLTDCALLRRLCKIALSQSKNQDTSVPDNDDVSILLGTLQKYQQQSRLLRISLKDSLAERDQLSRALAEQELSPRALLAKDLQEEVDQLKSQLATVRASFSFRLAGRIAQARGRFAPTGTKRHRFLEKVLRALASKPRLS
jgi:SAM-dependent methyltransferase